MLRDTYKKLGLVGLSLFAGVALTLLAQSNLQISPSANAADEIAVKPPQSWSLESVNSMKLEDLGKIDWVTVKSGGLYNSEISVFEGDNIVLVWESGPAKLLLDTPTALDEFVVVTKGILILTDNAGNSVTYNKGDMFMLPKGFTGTWEMPEEYRELIVVDTKAYNAP